MKKNMLLLFSVLVLALVFEGCTRKDGTAGTAQTTQTKPKNIELTWGAGVTTSPYYALYVNIAAGIQRANPNINFTIMETGGSVDGAKRLREEVCDIGSSNMQSDMESYGGAGVFEGDPCKDLRVLWYDHVSVYQWAASKDSGIKTFMDYDGKYISPGGAGTQQAIVSQQLYKLFGIKPRLLEGNQAVAADAFQNRQIGGIAKLGPTPDTYLQQLQAVGELVFIDISPEEFQKISTIYPAMSYFTVPAKAYGTASDWHSIALLGGSEALSSLPQDVGYILVKGIMVDARPEWEAAYPEGKDFDILGATLQSKVPLHAGTVQYMVEHGYTVPPNLIPPEYVVIK